MAAKKKAAPPPGKKKRKKQPPLVGFVTVREVRAALGGVSHVTVLNLIRKKKLAVITRTKGQLLFDGSAVTKFAATYKPQRNPPPGKGRWSKTAKRATRSKTRAKSRKQTGAGRRAGRIMAGA